MYQTLKNAVEETYHSLVDKLHDVKSGISSTRLGATILVPLTLIAATACSSPQTPEVKDKKPAQTKPLRDFHVEDWAKNYHTFFDEVGPEIGKSLDEIAKNSTYTKRGNLPSAAYHDAVMRVINRKKADNPKAEIMLTMFKDANYFYTPEAIDKFLDPNKTKIHKGTLYLKDSYLAFHDPELAWLTKEGTLYEPGKIKMRSDQNPISVTDATVYTNKAGVDVVRVKQGYRIYWVPFSDVTAEQPKVALSQRTDGREFKDSDIGTLVLSLPEIRKLRQQISQTRNFEDLYGVLRRHGLEDLYFKLTPAFQNMGFQWSRNALAKQFIRIEDRAKREQKSQK